MATCHAPALFLRQPGEDLAQLNATVEAMRKLGRVLDETKPDALIVLGLDHLEAFTLDVAPMFAIVVGDEVTGSFGPKRYQAAVHQPLARAILEGSVRRGFDLAFCQQAFMGHAFVVPFEYVLEERQIPIVPIFVNVYVPPLPQPRRCYDFGRAIASIVGEGAQRVAILASGGMSHYPGTDKYPNPEFGFDHWILGLLEKGQASQLLTLSSEDLDVQGETELLTWYTLFGAIGDQPGKLLSYQPTWHHGLGVLDFPLAEPLSGPPAMGALPEPASDAAPEYRYYRFPESSAFALNKLLYRLRMEPEQRGRFVADMEPMIAEYALPAGQAEALRSLDPLVVAKAGAHPIMAWTAIHLVQADLRAGRIGVPSA